MSEDLPTKEAAIRALKIMDALHKLGRKYPVEEVLAVVKQWAAYMDRQIERSDGSRDGWTCQRCFAMVQDQTGHDRWHEEGPHIDEVADIVAEAHWRFPWTTGSPRRDYERWSAM
jgi:hypothetical protein